jgi:hypothetical protein
LAMFIKALPAREGKVIRSELSKFALV